MDDDFKVVTSRSLGISFNDLSENIDLIMAIGHTEILGSRQPMGVTFKMLGKPRENWYDYRQHYINEDSFPIFTVTTGCLKRYNTFKVCYSCYKNYPKDNKFRGHGEDVPDTSEPCITSGEFNFKRRTI